MPYALLPNKAGSKGDGGYWVITKSTGKKHSIKPLTKEMAIAQMKALYLHGY